MSPCSVSLGLFAAQETSGALPQTVHQQQETNKSGVYVSVLQPPLSTALTMLAQGYSGAVQDTNSRQQERTASIHRCQVEVQCYARQDDGPVHAITSGCLSWICR